MSLIKIMLTDLWDYLLGEPDHLKHSKAKSLDDLLAKDGYRANNRFKSENQIDRILQR